MDFRDLPYPDASFRVVVFDPPHLLKVGEKGWMFKKYGRLDTTWRDDLRAGFAECFRVLADEGVLIFKWNEDQIPVSQILALTPHKPLVGHRRVGNLSVRSAVMTGTCGCGATWGGTKTEHCAACHCTFTGTYSGDMHRVGRHDQATGPDRRRCLSVEEMTALGMAQNKFGVWMSPGREAETARLSISA